MSDTPDSSQPQFVLQRIYLKDASFEVPGAPQVFLHPWQPEISLQMGTEVQPMDNGHYEVVLSLTVTAKNNDSTAFLVELKQAGIFLITNVPEQNLTGLLGSYCPNILFPYAREAISDIIGRGSFPQLLLAPVNFDAVLAQRQAQLAETQNPTAHPQNLSSQPQ